MSTGSADKLLDQGRPQAPGTAGAPRWYGDGKGGGVVADRWGRDEAKVRAQLELAEAIVKTLENCRLRAEELEAGSSLGRNWRRRLELSAAAFRRVASRDETILEEFADFRRAEEEARARLAGEAA